MTPAPPPQTPDPIRNSFGRGFGFVLALHLIQIPVVVLTMMMSLMIFSIVQLVYVIPIAIRAHRRHETSRLQGILTAAGLTVLVNGLCDVSFFRNFNPH